MDKDTIDLPIRTFVRKTIFAHTVLSGMPHATRASAGTGKTAFLPVPE
jgi:hypothetical protein